MTADAGSLEGWLEARLAGVPPELGDAVRAALGAGAETASIPGIPPGAARLGRAALRELDAVGAAARDRGAALRLLAADALLTYAFEAAADPELGGGASEAAALALRLGPRGELGARLAETAGRGGAAGGSS